MAIRLEEIEEVLTEFEAWKTMKANPSALDLSMQAYMREQVNAQNAEMIEEIRAIVANGDGNSYEAVIEDVEAALNQNG